MSPEFPSPLSATSCDALVIGAGPAGLMAAQALLEAGRSVVLAEAKPSVARKFLMAGKSGLNLTRIEDFEVFLAHYGASAHRLRPMLQALPPKAVRTWAEELGQETFVGSTGRLFPRRMKASPLLRAWLARLEGKGLQRETRWRWVGLSDGLWRFETADGPRALRPKVCVLACGGGSWARLGSDGRWQSILRPAEVAIQPFQASNAGVVVRWSHHMKDHFGAPLKGVAFHAGSIVSRGEATISERGLEGGGIYPLCPALREGAPLHVDLAPDVSVERLVQKLARPRGKQSLSNHLRRALRLGPAVQALLMELGRPLPQEPEALARKIKALPICHDGLRPLDEAISTAGGVSWDGLDSGLMLHACPGVFCAGEMIDWDAPTGGYLLTASLATGLWAGQHAARWR